MSTEKFTSKFAVNYGANVIPIKRIEIFSPEEWEEFTSEWLELKKKVYCEIERLGGANDKGRDVVAYITDKNNPKHSWDFLITIGIFTGAFFPKFLDFATEYEDFKTASKLLIPVIILYFFLFITIDRFIIKDIVLEYRNSKNRIIRTLENIYLDRYVE